MLMKIKTYLAVIMPLDLSSYLRLVTLLPMPSCMTSLKSTMLKVHRICRRLSISWMSITMIINRPDLTYTIQLWDAIHAAPLSASKTTMTWLSSVFSLQASPPLVNVSATSLNNTDVQLGPTLHEIPSVMDVKLNRIASTKEVQSVLAVYIHLDKLQKHWSIRPAFTVGEEEEEDQTHWLRSRRRCGWHIFSGRYHHQSSKWARSSVWALFSWAATATTSQSSDGTHHPTIELLQAPTASRLPWVTSRADDSRQVVYVLCTSSWYHLWGFYCDVKESFLPRHPQQSRPIHSSSSSSCRYASHVEHSSCRLWTITGEWTEWSIRGRFQH